MKIPLQATDYSSILPADLANPAPSSTGLDLNNLAPEQAAKIPDTGKATVHYKVHRRSSDQQIDEGGKKRESHRISMHLNHFEPHTESDEEAAPEKKPLTKSRDAQKAVREGMK